MAARSSFTRVSGGVITTAWANSLRDHVAPYSTTANDGTTEGMLSINTTSDTLRVGTGSTTVELASYGAYQSTWTPQVTQSIPLATTTNIARVARYGRTVVANFRVTLATNGLASNIITLPLPVTAANTTGVLGTGYFYDTSAAIYYPFIALQQFASATTMVLLSTSTSVTNFLGVATYTDAVRVDDIIEGQLIYEAAT